MRLGLLSTKKRVLALYPPRQAPEAKPANLKTSPKPSKLKDDKIDEKTKKFNEAVRSKGAIKIKTPNRMKLLKLRNQQIVK